MRLLYTNFILCLLITAPTSRTSCACNTSPVIEYLTNPNLTHIAHSILYFLSPQDLSNLASACKALKTSTTIQDELIIHKIIMLKSDPVGYIERHTYAGKSYNIDLIERMILHGIDIARIGKEDKEHGIYVTRTSRPPRVMPLIPLPRLDVCACHNIHATGADSPESVISLINKKVATNPGSAIFLEIYASQTPIPQFFKITPEFICRLAQYPIIGLILCDVAFNEDAARSVQALAKLTELRELFIQNPSLELSHELIEGGMQVNNNQLLKTVTQLTNLRALALRSSNICSIPPDLSRLTKLRYLDLSSNNIDRLPVWIGQLPALETLKMVNNALSTLPTQLGTLKKLRLLNLGNNPLTISTADQEKCLGRLIQLRHLNLDLTLIKAISPKLMYQLKKLKSIILSSTQLTSLPKNINTLRELKKLDVAYSHIETLPLSVACMRHLSKIYMGATTYIPWALIDSCAQDDNFPSIKLFLDNDLTHPLIVTQHDFAFIKKLRSCFPEKFLRYPLGLPACIFARLLVHMEEEQKTATKETCSTQCL